MSESRSLFGGGAKVNGGGGSVTKVLNFDDVAAEAEGGGANSTTAAGRLSFTKIAPEATGGSSGSEDSDSASESESDALSAGIASIMATPKVRAGTKSTHAVKRHQSRGWNVLQKKADDIGKEVHIKKIKGTFKKAIVTKDRRHRITMQIDGIRQEQLQRLHKRDVEREEKNKILTESAKLWKKLRTFTIHPQRRWKQTWDIFILLLVVFSAVHIPLLLAFPDLPDIGAYQITIDVLFIIDFFLCFRTGFLRPDNEIELEQGKIVSHYLKTWFPIDFAACFPLDIFFQEKEGSEQDASSRQVKALLRLLKLPRLLRLGRLLKFLARFKYAGAMKILKFVLLLILVGHWTGCVFFFILNLENQFGYDTWMEPNVGLIVDGDNIRGRYLNMLYTAFLMLIGEGMDMETSLERAFGALVVLIGTIVTAVIVGNVSFVVSNQNSTQFQYQKKIDMITDEMRALHLPGELQDRTLKYYEYLWNRHRSFDPRSDRFTRDLSPTLRKEILLHMNRECVLNCDFFRDVSNECIIGLVHSFKFAVYLEHDVIAEEGEMAEDLVFLIHGSAKVTKVGRIMPVSLLTPGDYFGEKSLLMHHRNAVSVIATENCDTRILNAVDFEDLTIDFPELEESIRKRSDHMDVTEYDAHTKRHTIMARSRNTRRVTRVINVADLANPSAFLQAQQQQQQQPSPSGLAGSFEWQAVTAAEVAANTTGPGKSGRDGGGRGGRGGNMMAGGFMPGMMPGMGGPDTSRPMTAGSKARISEMAASVKRINGRVDAHTKQLKRLESYLVSVDSKLDLVLKTLNGGTAVETTGVGTPAPSSTGFSL